MLGFTAKVDPRDGGAEIRVDGEELDEARWFSREELAAGMAAGTTLPPGGISIARRLLELWYGGPLPEPLS
jgi:NAD+ diphosphatase